MNADGTVLIDAVEPITHPQNRSIGVNRRSSAAKDCSACGAIHASATHALELRI
jgi:hypothetical protein